MKKSCNRRKFIRTAAIASIGMGIGSNFYCNPKDKTKIAAGGRVGIIGLDTSHSIAFTKIFNEARSSDELRGYRVVAAFPTKGSPDIESSISRLAGFTKEMEDLGVPLVSSIEELIDKTDVILLETNDGRLHLEQALPVLKAGKKLFIDKPLAASLGSVLAIFEAAKKYNTPVFSSSSLRYFENIQDIIPEKMGRITGADTFSPATLEKAHSDLFWYGIHGVEMLYTVLGTNCKNVSRLFTGETDIVTGHWDDNRIGSFRGLRTGKMDYGGIVFGEKDIVTIKPGKDYGYRSMMMKTVEFFQTGKPPVSPEETIGIYTFMAAAEESSRNNGILVSIENTLKKARQIINN
ncbi:MAG: Gfo/Idh/MocA family protein [Chitinophagaceae bacterium]